MRYVKATTIDQLPTGGKLKANVEGQTLLLTNIDGEYYAVNNRCPHMGGSLYDGILEGDTITCPRHKSRFNVKTGDLIQGGHIAFIHLKVKDAKAYPVKIEGEDLLVGLE